MTISKPLTEDATPVERSGAPSLGRSSNYEPWAAGQIDHDSRPLCVYTARDLCYGSHEQTGTLTLGPTPEQKVLEKVYGHDTITVVLNERVLSSPARVPGMGKTLVQLAAESFRDSPATLICDLEPAESDMRDPSAGPFRVSPAEAALHQMVNDGTAHVAVSSPRLLPESYGPGHHSFVWDQAQQRVVNGQMPVAVEYPDAAMAEADGEVDKVRLALEAKAQRGEVLYAFNVPMVRRQDQPMTHWEAILLARARERQASVYAMVGGTVASHTDG